MEVGVISQVIASGEVELLLHNILQMASRRPVTCSNISSSCRGALERCLEERAKNRELRACIFSR